MVPSAMPVRVSAATESAPRRTIYRRACCGSVTVSPCSTWMMGQSFSRGAMRRLSAPRNNCIAWIWWAEVPKVPIAFTMNFLAAEVTGVNDSLSVLQYGL
ncbi:hypothetical protein D3C85_1570860 [compost metagenome]